MRGRPMGAGCSVCQHPERIRAELALAKGEGFVRTARKFAMSEDAIERHWKRHVGPERLASLTTESRRQEFVSAVIEENESALEHAKGVRCGLEQRFYAVLREGHDDLNLVRLAHALRAINDSIGKMTGELCDSPLVAIQNNQLTVAAVMESPAYAQFWAEVISALHGLPNFHEIHARLSTLVGRYDRAEAAALALPKPQLSCDAEKAAEVAA